MTKKDYELIAKVINKLDAIREHSGYIGIDILIDELAKVFANKNSRFDEQKFKEACYGK